MPRYNSEGIQRSRVNITHPISSHFGQRPLVSQVTFPSLCCAEVAYTEKYGARVRSDGVEDKLEGSVGGR
eukprot:5344561-Pyramimonas_sp.AAC.1